MLFYPLIFVHLPFPSVSCVVSSLPGTIAGVKALARHFHSHIGSTSLLVMALLGFRRFPFCHRGTTSHHPFRAGMFHEINKLAIGVPKNDYGNQHETNQTCKHYHVLLKKHVSMHVFEFEADISLFMRYCSVAPWSQKYL